MRSSYVCGSPSDTECDNPDTCTGTVACQPNYEPSGTACTPDTNTCTFDQCNGAGTCAHPTMPDGSSCDDSDVCTSPDTCTSGTCGGPAVIVPEIDDSVLVAKNVTVAVISWNDPPGAYNVYRGSRRNGIPWSYNHVCLDGPTQNSSAVDPVMPQAGVTLFYLVSRRTQCGESIVGRNSNNVPDPNPHPCSFPDFDNDGVVDKFDNCPTTPNPGQEDADGDALGDVCDNCPIDFNPGQEDFDHDGTGNACDPTPLSQGGTGMQAPGASGPASGGVMIARGTESVDPEAIRVPELFRGARCSNGAPVVLQAVEVATARYTLEGGA